MKLFFLLIVLLSSSAFAAFDCGLVLTRINPDPSFVSYLQRLLDSRVVGDRELVRLFESLEVGKIVNPISETDATVNSDLLVHREGIDRFLKGLRYDRDEVSNWVRGNLEKRRIIVVKRNDVRTETQDTEVRMKFNTVKPATFWRNGRTISEPFELMSTLVTQWHWAMVMGENPSMFRDGKESVELNVEGKMIRMRPDNPVENIVFAAIQQFLNRLNEMSERDDARLYKLIVDHQRGDQYRLPFEIEWEFVESRRGQSKTKYFFGNDISKLQEYAWYRKNQTMPVGQLKALEIDGNKFFDIYGNVAELMQDQAHGTGHVIRGGSFMDSPPVILARSLAYDHFSGSSIGLRLVRVRE